MIRQTQAFAARPVPEGTAYGRPPGYTDELLTRVGPGTPCGELMRRYWQPVLVAEGVTRRPQAVRMLGEDLIVFRDGDGRPGLLYERCGHRGASLFWGHVEEDGIRCCYHGWKFDVEGHCLEQPCEPKGGVNRAAHRQPWYPVEEHYGLLWAYMGPPDRMPLFPRFDCMELEEGERYFAFDNSIPSHADANGPAILPNSWLNINDNCMDPAHVEVLHATFSTTQFVSLFATSPKLKFEAIEGGVIYKADRNLDDGRRMRRVNSWFAPNITSVPSLTAEAGGSNSLTIFLPVDDTHCRVFGAFRVKADFKGIFAGAGFADAKPWTQMTLEERQDMPGDYEAQSGFSLHSEEHLVTTDIGIGLQRRLLRREVDKVSKGEDPVGIAFEPGAEIVRVPSGNFYYAADERTGL
ncbi:MAG TPA: Rieske 2Fe-2S domain-containing protein [Novosphingobium sp.]|nr:Rieske 2Fe-2S domain-containing protein [Novosphingobium sp.]